MGPLRFPLVEFRTNGVQLDLEAPTYFPAKFGKSIPTWGCGTFPPSYTSYFALEINVAFKGIYWRDRLGVWWIHPYIRQTPLHKKAFSLVPHTYLFDLAPSSRVTPKNGDDDEEMKKIRPPRVMPALFLLSAPSLSTFYDLWIMYFSKVAKDVRPSLNRTLVYNNNGWSQCTPFSWENHQPTSRIKWGAAERRKQSDCLHGRGGIPRWT